MFESNPYSLSIAAENLICDDKETTFFPRVASDTSENEMKLWTIHGAYETASFGANFTETGSMLKKFIY